MPLSPVNIPHVNTIPITSAAGAFTYTFEMEESQTAQILWAQFAYTADAVVGNRRPLFLVQDENGNNVVLVSYFNNILANQSVNVSFTQGNTILPNTVLGAQVGIPFNGVFVKNDWVFSIFAFPSISVGDIFTGFFQTKGLHNSEAPN